MELTTIFTGLVFAIGLFHVIVQASSVIDRYLFSGRNKYAGTRRKAAFRDDWYMFFHCSNLTGEGPGKTQADGRHDHSSMHAEKTTRADQRRQPRRMAY